MIYLNRWEQTKITNKMSIKRTIITTLVALALVAVVAPGAAQALTANDLQVQINQLLAQLQTLQGQSNTGSTTGILPANCVGVDFDRDLARDAVGSDVKCMQSILNQLNVQVADTGAGSPGHETTYFGGATRAAVIRFQEMFTITPAAGYVGPLTRAKLNSLLLTWRTAPVVTPPVGCTSTSGYNPTTGASCATTTFPAGCTSTAGYSSTTGASCSTGVVNPVVTLPAGCTSTSGYSSTTGVSCSTGVANPVLGSTGFISLADIAAAPASNANVTATTNVPVLGLDLKAIGANLTVSSAKVELAVTKSAVAQYPSTLVNNLYVYDGSTLLGTYPVNSSTIITDNSGSSNVYYMILSGFNFNLPGNTTKTLTINADFAPSLDTSRVLTVGLYGASDAIRATDPSGAYSTAGGSATARTYTITYSTVGTSTLTVVADTATPISTSINVNHTSGTTNVPTLLVDAKSTTGASTITNLKFTLTGDATALDNVTAVKLYDGSNLLNSVSPVLVTATNYTATLNNLSIPVAQDATKQLTVDVDLASGATNSTGIIVSIAAPSTDVTYQEPNMSSANPSSSAVTGNEMYLFDGNAAVLSFTNATSAYTYNTTTPSASYTTGVITFNARADGGTMTALTNSTIKVRANTGAGLQTLGAGSVNVDFAPVGGTDGNNISDGGTAVVTVTVTLPYSTSSTGFANFYIYEIDWVVGTSGTVAQTWGLGSYKTPYANVQ
jgi:hypothetical protein